MLELGIKPSDILTREAFEDAITVTMALGGSTNATLHLLAIAHAANVDLSLEDFNTIQERVPHLADLKPSGQYVFQGPLRSRWCACGYEVLVGKWIPSRRPYHMYW